MKLWTVLCLLFGAGLSAQAENLVTWYSIDLPPIYVVSGPNQGKGQLDLLTAFLRDKLPEYRHQTETASIPRILERMKAAELAVFAGVQKTPEREAAVLFSAPFLATQPPFLVVRRDDAPRLADFLDAQGAVDLDRWLKAHSLGLVAGRSYTAPVDGLLSGWEASGRLVRRYSANELAGGLVSMLTRGRVDGVLSFRSELMVLSGAESAVAASEIQGIPDEVPLYIIVTKSAEGAVLLRKINALLKTYWNDPVMRGRAQYPDNDFVRQFLARGYRE